jgi:hypothetical protein
MGATALSGTAYAFGLLRVVFLLAPLLVCGLAVWFPGAYPDYEKTEDDTLRASWHKGVLTILISLGSLSTLAFSWLTWSYLSWPNRQTLGLIVQAPLLMSMIYQYQYLAFVWRGKCLPSIVWPMRIIAIGMGGTCTGGTGRRMVSASAEIAFGIAPGGA